MKKLISCARHRSRPNNERGAKRRRSEDGQAFLETVMSTAFLVVIAIAMSKMLRPIVVEAFEKIATALSAVGP